MKIVCGFQIELWEQLGFKFEVSSWFEGGQIWYTEKQFDSFIFSLRINTHSGHTLAKIENLHREKIGNHVVSEKDAIDWFSTQSGQFIASYQDYKKAH
jgi:hypothetical protein